MTSQPMAYLPLCDFFPKCFSHSPDSSPKRWRIYLSLTPVPSTLHTRHKTSRRSHYNLARAGMNATDVDVEVLLQNHSGEITEGTFTTPYFYRNGIWVTPQESCGGNKGTTRRWALENELAAEGLVMANGLSNHEVVWLSNGVRGFGWGMLELH